MLWFALPKALERSNDTPSFIVSITFTVGLFVDTVILKLNQESRRSRDYFEKIVSKLRPKHFRDYFFKIFSKVFLWVFGSHHFRYK